MSLQYRQIHSQQVESEILSAQLYVAKKQPEIIVEIGTSYGGTVLRWLQIQTVKTFVSIDLPDGIHGGAGWENRKQLLNEIQEYCINHNIEFFSISGDSSAEDSLNKLKNFLRERYIDVLFIDGNHTYDGVANDFILYSELIKEDGLILFHDIRDSQWQRNVGAFVDYFWNDIKVFFDTTVEFITNNVEECYKKIPESKPYGFGGIGIIEYNEKQFAKAKQFLIEKNILEERKNETSIVIATCGLDDTIYTCIDSIINNVSENSLFAVSEINIIVNGSTEEWYKQLQEKYSNISSIQFNYVYYKNPLGFSGAYNKGLQLCSNEYVIILNDDTELLNDTWLDLLCIPLWKNPKIGLYASAIKKEDNCALGFCFATRKSILNTVGLFNEGFNEGYYEDNEFTHRIKNAGYIVDGLNEISFDRKEENNFTFPINHFGMKTFSSMYNESEKKDIISSNKNKFEIYNKEHNIQYCIISNDYEYIKQSLSELYIDETTLILIIIDTVKISSKDILNINKQDNDKIHIISLCDIKSNPKSIAESFFGNNNIIYVKDITIQDENITWMAKFDDHSSMGVLSQNILEMLDDKTFNKHAKNIIGKDETKNKFINKLISKNEIKKDTAIMFSYPYMINEMSGYDLKINYTGLDTKNGLQDFSLYANQSDVLLTPSMYSKNNMLHCGVNKPIFVFPHGINPNIFSYTEEKKNDKFTYVYCGECSDRKGIFQLLQAYKKLLIKDSSVYLILQSNKDVLFYNNELLLKTIKNLGLENDVELIQENISQEDVVKIMKRGHCYVYPSRADSFGMTVLEAMAVGLPVITHENLGVSEFIKDKYIKVKSKEVPITNHPIFLPGKWYEVNHNDLYKSMIEVKNNYESYKEKAREYSLYIHNNFSWESVVKKFEPTLRVLTQQKKKKIISCFIASYNRPEYLFKTINSLIQKKYSDIEYEYQINIFEQSNREIQDIIYKRIKSEYGNVIDNVYCSKDNIGQRGAINMAYHLGWFKNSDFIMLSDQDNIFHKPLSIYVDVLKKYSDCEIVTGYLSKEHIVSNVINDNKIGKILLKNTCRAGHMFYRAKDLLQLFPLELDYMLGRPENSSWNIGLDWMLISWHPNSPINRGKKNFIYCIPNGVEHIGYDSTWRETNKEQINKEEIDQLVQWKDIENNDLTDAIKKIHDN